MLDTVTGEIIDRARPLRRSIPASHYVASRERLAEGDRRRSRSSSRSSFSCSTERDKLLEAQRLGCGRSTTSRCCERSVSATGSRTTHGTSRAGRRGSRPNTLLDYFPDDFLVVLDESHVGVPQLNGMYEGDKSRKETLVEHGFRLPSALDNRPLRFDEFWTSVNQVVFMSATPGPFELRMRRALRRADRPAHGAGRPRGADPPQQRARSTT